RGEGDGAWKHADHCGERMSRRDRRVQTRERADRLRHALIGFRPAREISDAVPHLSRLLEVDAIFHQRAADFESRIERLDSQAAVAAGANRWSEAVRVELPSIAAAARLNDDQA